ncbi:uncharacterized protein FFUJ_08389 [Fusarium fujikuroi IMI 58289]|uniref:Uncharacterized protein n=1 Tax=Gibberella fujikuroi (strain CBS 195.34 / IMI 58289 / NRRL A-6831) TaxID=1279085 RepID=S0EGN3_GIBF5|nr:uncharacterized protein FFUJ_08389 [Fusarium fujikuroi IMI 58289]CCT71528.1 uncharacterized protein FFUJ_08389 [Fusarium fujikuroi IMI 58289]
MSGNGNGSSKWPDFRLASTLWSLMPGSQSNRPDKQNDQDRDGNGNEGHKNEQQLKNEPQGELPEELMQSLELTQDEVGTGSRPIDEMSGFDNYDGDAQSGPEDDVQDQDFGTLEMFDSNATQAPYTSQLDSASQEDQAPEAPTSEDIPSSQSQKHKRDKKGRKQKGINESESPQLPAAQGSSRKSKKSKKKSTVPVEIPDSLIENNTSTMFPSQPLDNNLAVDLDDEAAAPATQTKRKRNPSDSTDGKQRKKRRSRDEAADIESQLVEPGTQDGQIEEADIKESQAASFLRTRDAARPASIYDDVAEDVPQSPSAARLEVRDARSREGSAAHDEMDIDASVKQTQDQETEVSGFSAINGQENTEHQELEQVARDVWNAHINGQNQPNTQDPSVHPEEMEVPTSAQRPHTSNDVYDVPGSPVQASNPPSASAKKSPSPEVPEGDLPSPSAMTPMPRKRTKKASNRRKSEANRALSSQDMEVRDDDDLYGNPATGRRNRMAGFTQGRFTGEELSRIAQAVESYRVERNMVQHELNAMIHAPGGTTAGDEHAALWARIFATCPDRHRQKIINITRKKFHNFVARGTWTSEQDAELRDLIEANGTKWSKIAGIINRHPEDLRDRYRNYIICGDSQRKDTWDEEEEGNLTQYVMEAMAAIDELRIIQPTRELLKKPYEELIDWQNISERMGRTRSRLQCITKWRAMNIKTHGKDKLVSHAPDASISFRLEKARRQIAAMPEEERYRMIMAISGSSASIEAKIPWQRLVDKQFRNSWHRPTQMLLWRRLKQSVPESEQKTVRDSAQYLLNLYAQTGELPNVDDALFDDAEEMEFVNSIPTAHASHNNTPANGQSHMSAEFVNEADEEETEQPQGEYGVPDENINPDLPIAPMEDFNPAPMASMDPVAAVADLAPMEDTEMVDPALSADHAEPEQPEEPVDAPMKEEPVPVAKPTSTPVFDEPAPPKATRVAKRTAPSQDPIEDDGEVQAGAPAEDNSEVDEAQTRKRKTPSRFRSAGVTEVSAAADDSDSVMDDMEDLPARVM